MRKPDFVAREEKRADWPVVQSMRGSREFFQRGSKFDFFNGPSSIFRGRFAGGEMMVQH